jgi:hypothetical protein
MDNLIKLRKDLFVKTNVKISLNDYLIKAVALALRVSNVVFFTSTYKRGIKFG